MGMSISLKKDTRKTNIKHNNRKMTDDEKKKNDHIDFSRSNENNYLVSKSLKELYKSEFGQAQKEYNDKQKRADRKIHNYYDHVQKGKKTSLQQEMILQVGDKDDFNDNPENRKLANEVLEEWFHKFEERNPNLKVYNAVIHNDEASPHMHLNFVPVATGYKRGMDKQVSFDKAILQQDHTLNKERPFDDWRNKEVLLLEKMLKERGIERNLVGTNDFKDVNDLKEKKDELRELENRTLETKQEFEEVYGKLRETADDLDLKEMKVAYLDEKIVEKERKIAESEKKFAEQHKTLQKDVQGLLKAVESSKSVESIQVDKGGVFDRKSVKMSVEDFESIKTLAMASEAFKTQNEKLQREMNVVQSEKREMQQENVELKDKHKKLKAENSRLEEVNEKSLKTIEYLKDMIHLIKKNSEKFLEITKDEMSNFVGKVRMHALLHEYKKTKPEKLFEAVPEDEKEGAKIVLDVHKASEKEKPKEAERER
jgi:hypothetical protein